jgi:hypothetical protein
MAICAPYQILFRPFGSADAVVLCAAGQEMEQLIQIDSASQNMVTAEGILADEAFFKPTGGVVMQLSFTVRTVYTSYVLACEAHDRAGVIGGVDVMRVTGLLQVVFLDALTSAPLWFFVFDQAAITSITPSLPSDAPDEPTVARAYQVTAVMNAAPTVPNGFRYGLGGGRGDGFTLPI